MDSNVAMIREALNEGGPATMRVLARLRLCRMKMRREKKLSSQGHRPPHGHDVQRIWRQYGWRPSRWYWSREQMGFRPFQGDGGLDTPARSEGVILPLIDGRRAR